MAMSKLVDEWRMDRAQWSESTLAEQGRDRAYWLTHDPAERLAAIELARQIYYGYDPATTRLQEFLQYMNSEQVEYLFGDL
jgi:hypothetical protein